MQKAGKVQKNSMALTILLTILIMIAAGIACLLFFLNTAFTSFIDDCRSFDSLTEKMALTAEMQIEKDIHNVVLYSRLLLSEGIDQEQEVRNLFSIFEKQQDFAAVGLMEEDGSVLTNVKSSFDKLSDEALAKIKTGQQSCFTDSGSMFVVYVQPLLMEDNRVKTLVALKDSKLTEYAFDKNMNEYNSILYILNEEKEVVYYLGGAGKGFAYDSIYESQFYKNYDNYKDYISMMKALFDRMKPIEESLAGKRSIFKGGEDVINTLLRGSSYLWYEKPLAINGVGNFTLLIGNWATVSKETVDSILNVAILITCVMSAFSLLLLYVILSQGMSNRKLTKMAYLDLIIEGPNWNRFKLDVARTLRLRGKRMKYAIVSFDIRKFRVISDLDGHHKGEELLLKVARILRGQIRRREYFARFAVDEFAVLLSYEEEKELTGRIKAMDEIFKEQIRIKGLNFIYGVYYIKDIKVSVNRMYMYSAIAKDSIRKNTEKNIGIFDDSMHMEIVREQEIEKNMEAALENKEFLVYLQPKYRVDNQKVDGAEALVRWNSPVLGFISPGEFIPMFEKNGFIIKLDRYMLEEICKCQSRWLKEGNELVTISVNISRAHLLDPLLAEHIAETIDFYHLPHDCIELELTESAFFDDKATLLYTVNKLRETGFRVSMDDFGSGYSSLNSLKDLPLDVIKLDGEFFHYTTNIKKSETVILDTISMAKHLNMRVVAEGIETEEQVKFLEKAGCDLIQGYYFAKPMPVKDFEQLMNYSDSEE